MGSHFMKAYASKVVSIVYRSAEMNFAEKQSELEAALFDYSSSPFWTISLKQIQQEHTLN
jgi:hypothetical protein